MSARSERSARSRPAVGAALRVAVAVLLAFLVFNAVFDRRLAEGVRQYVAAAEAAAAHGRPFLHVHEVLGPVTSDGVRTAAGAALATLAIVLVPAGLAARRRTTPGVDR